METRAYYTYRQVDVGERQVMNREAAKAFEAVGKTISSSVSCYVACFLFCSVEGHVGSVVQKRERNNNKWGLTLQLMYVVVSNF